MRKQVVLGMLAVLAGTTLASRTASAQEQSGTSTQFSLGGGVDLPMGDFDDAANTGYHGLAAVTFTPATWPVGIQIDGNYGRFPDELPGRRQPSDDLRHRQHRVPVPDLARVDLPPLPDRWRRRVQPQGYGQRRARRHRLHAQNSG